MRRCNTSKIIKQNQQHFAPVLMTSGFLCIQSGMRIPTRMATPKIIRFRLDSRSTACRFDTPTPITIDRPMIMIPPRTGSGMVDMAAPNFPNIPATIMKIPATCHVIRLPIWKSISQNADYNILQSQLITSQNISTVQMRGTAYKQKSTSSYVDLQARNLWTTLW